MPFKFIASTCLALTFSAAFAQGLSQRCASEIKALQEDEYFSADEFLKELPASVTKVKAQEKAGGTPVIGFLLGPGDDDKETDAGITVGCAKTFPENSGEMQASLKEASLMLGVNAMDSKEAVYGSIDSGIESKKGGGHFWLALTLDLVGAGFIAYGIAKNSEASKNYDEYKSLGSRASQPDIDNAYGKVKTARSSRNFAYAVGAPALALGIGAHIWF